MMRKCMLGIKLRAARASKQNETQQSPVFEGRWLYPFYLRNGQGKPWDERFQIRDDFEMSANRSVLCQNEEALVLEHSARWFVQGDRQ